MNKPRITIEYVSDSLFDRTCSAQIKSDELRRMFSAEVLIQRHYIPVFGDAANRIGDGWQDRGVSEGLD